VRTRSTSLALSFVLSCIACSGIAAAQAPTESGFRPLFDGKTLTGWVQHGGKAKYAIENGEIIGTSVVGTPNSFLCTDRDYGDFILEVEFKVDQELNSGIQIRSQVFAEPKVLMAHGKPLLFDGKPRTIEAGRVHGYQVEIDPSDRAWTGGIYDEGRRGWLFNLKEKPEAGKAFKQGEWNKFRVECKGDSIKTFINGVAAADLKDDVTPSGFISLQVHATKNPKPLEVRWRNIYIKELK
jgi:hypothetical protein